MTSFSFSKTTKSEKKKNAFKQHLHAEKRSRDKRLLKETVAASQKRHTQWAMNSQLMKTKDVSQPTRWFVGSHVSSLRKNFCMCQIIWYDSRNDENAMSPWSQFHLFLVFLSSSSPLLLTKAASRLESSKKMTFEFSYRSYSSLFLLSNYGHFHPIFDHN